MVSSIASNSTTAFANQQQPTDEMKAKVAADTRARAEAETSPEKMRTEAEKRSADMEKRFADVGRQGKFVEISMLQTKKEMTLKMENLAKDLLIKLEKIAQTPPEPAKVLKGADAERVWNLAQERSKLSQDGHFPPDKDTTYIFVADGYQYNISGNGKITQKKEGVLPQEEHEGFVKDLNERKSRQPTFLAENKAKIDEFDNRKVELLSELGLTEDEWRAQVKTSGNISIEV